MISTADYDMICSAKRCCVLFNAKCADYELIKTDCHSNYLHIEGIQEKDMSLKNAFFKTISYARRNGIKAAWYAAAERLQDQKKEYTFCGVTQEELQCQATHYRNWIEEGASIPKITIVVPCYQTPEKYLVKMIQSVLDQSYGNWELVIADATETDHENAQDANQIAGIVAKTAANDKRVIYHHLMCNGGISDNTNSAIELATGDYICLLDHDDLLTPDAIYEMAQTVLVRMKQSKCRKLSECPLYLVYSDEDKCDGEEKRFYEPNRKPDFNLDYLLSNNYICHFSMFRADVLKSLRFRKKYDGAQDYDVILRTCGAALTQVNEAAICHIPKVLYHWRCHSGSTASNPSSKRYAYEAGRKAVENFLQEQGIGAYVTELGHVGFYRVSYQSDVFTARTDIGIIGGRLENRKGTLCGGIYLQDASALYEGLPKGFSGGAQHRAVLQQDADAVDLRCMRIRPELQEIFQQITGLQYQETSDGESNPSIPDSWDEMAIRRCSTAFCSAVREKGYRILWDPEIRKRV